MVVALELATRKVYYYFRRLEGLDIPILVTTLASLFCPRETAPKTLLATPLYTFVFVFERGIHDTYILFC